MQTTRPASPASLQVEPYSKMVRLDERMLTPQAIEVMTARYNSPADTVAVWAGEKYVPSISRCIAEIGRTKVEALFKLRLIRLNVLSNAARPMTEAMIDELVPVIIKAITDDCATTFTLADIRIVFDRADRGYYGKMYGGYNASDVLGWFQQYDREKCQAIDAFEVRRKEAELNAGAGNNNIITEVAKNREAQRWYIQEKAKKS